MTRPVRIGLVQGQAFGSPASFDVDANRSYYMDLLERCCVEGKPDVVLMPEVFTAPYFCSRHDQSLFDLAEPIPGPTTDAVAEIAKRHGCYVFASIFEQVLPGEYYDSYALVGPDGALVPAEVVGSTAVLPAARKVHIPAIDANGTRTDEKFWFRPGQGLSIFRTPFGVIGCLVCYDRSFPEAWRTLALAGAELIVIPVASYGFREEMFLAEIRTSATQNGVFAAAANRVGVEKVDVEVNMFGTSSIVGPTGAVIANAGNTEVAVLTSEVDLDDVVTARRSVPFLRDRRQEVYHL